MLRSHHLPLWTWLGPLAGWLLLAAAVTVHLLLGLGLGWALAQPRWPGRTLVDALVTLPLVFPPIALGFFFHLVRPHHLTRRTPPLDGHVVALGGAAHAGAPARVRWPRGRAASRA